MLTSDAFFFFSFAQKTISILTADFEDLKISDNILPRHIPCLKNVSVCRLRRKPLSISVFLPFFTATKKVNNTWTTSQYVPNRQSFFLPNMGHGKCSNMVKKLFKKKHYGNMPRTAISHVDCSPMSQITPLSPIVLCPEPT
jgi:hypothetical protein